MLCQEAFKIGRASAGKMRRRDPELVQKLGEARPDRRGVVVLCGDHLAVGSVISVSRPVIHVDRLAGDEAALARNLAGVAHGVAQAYFDPFEAALVLQLLGLRRGLIA